MLKFFRDVWKANRKSYLWAAPSGCVIWYLIAAFMAASRKMDPPGIIELVYAWIFIFAGGLVLMFLISLFFYEREETFK